MSGDSKLAVSLLDLKLGGSGRDAQGVVVGGISDHGVRQKSRGWPDTVK